MKKKILELRKMGKTYNEIQKILNCSKGTISYHCGVGQAKKTRSRLRASRARKKTAQSFAREMDDKTWVGSLAEVKVIAQLTMDKFHVFNQISGKAPYDLIAIKKNKIIRVSVKGTLTKRGNSGSYQIQISRVRSNKKTNKIYKFNNEECDVLAIYIYEIDTVCFLDSSKIKTTRSINLRLSPAINKGDSKFLISNLNHIEII